jgi:hypothetical protein
MPTIILSRYGKEFSSIITLGSSGLGLTRQVPALARKNNDPVYMQARVI